MSNQKPRATRRQKNTALGKALIGTKLYVHRQPETVFLNEEDIGIMNLQLKARGYRIVRIRRRSTARKGR